MTDTSGRTPDTLRRDPVTGALLADEPFGGDPFTGPAAAAAPAPYGSAPYEAAPVSGTSDAVTSGATSAGPGASGSGASGTAGAAKEQASRLGGEAAQSGQHVAGVAKEQAASVASEAGRQAKDLLHQTRGELGGQASAQKDRAATGLHSLGADLGKISRGETPDSGLATEFAQQASDRVTAVARWLEDREPAELLHDVQNFARRRPGTFLAIAAGVGLAAGRLTRGVAAATREEHAAAAAPAPTSPAPVQTAPAYGTAYGTGSVDELGGVGTPGTVDPYAPLAPTTGATHPGTAAPDLR